ncbi:hypothetical protein E5C31_12420 [Providencia rettgeri]|nr:hypothetical protein [Providencia rettgeri]
MIDLLIDAPILACPHDDLEEKQFNEEFLDFVTALSDISRFRRSVSSSRIWREASLASTLYMIDAYPFKHVLARAMPRLDPSLGFQLEDIANLALALLSKSNCLNDVSDLEDVVVENGEITDDPIPSRGPELTNYACRATEFAFSHLGAEKALPSSIRFVSRAPKTENTTSIVRYSLTMASYRDGSMQCPEINREVKMTYFYGTEFTLRNLDPSLIWMKADEPSLLDALAIFAANQGDISHFELAEFKKNIKIGNSMLDSCQNHGFLHEPTKVRRLIAACVDICLGRNLDQSHWLRKGKGPGEPQKGRGGNDFAWRHDIDHDFHLHYWKDGVVIELANVVVHNDFRIAE